MGIADKSVFFGVLKHLKLNITVNIELIFISNFDSKVAIVASVLQLPKVLQTFVTNNVFLDKKITSQQQKTNINTLAGAGD